MFGGSLLTSCKDVEHCPSDTFCDTTDLVCRPCIQCVDLRRLPPPANAPVICITSATQCGSCFTGLVENKSLSMECVEAVEASAGSAWDEWLVLLVALHLLALLLCVCAALVLRNFRAYKLRASTCVETGTAPLPPPPPYNTTSAILPSQNLEREETSSPLIKETLLSLPSEAAVTGIRAPSSGRESDRLQGARVFNEPVYQILNTSDENYPTPTEMLQRYREPQTTRDSTVQHYNGARSEITLPDATQANNSITKTFTCSARKQRVRQDSMNDSEDSGYGEPHASTASPGAAIFTSNNSIPFFINVFKNFTTVSQDDDSVF